jgi:hypothetical protein
MEFSYRISETDYLNAEKPLKTSISSTVKSIVFWLVIIAFGIVVITAVSYITPHPPVAQQSAVQSVGSNRNVFDYLDSFALILATVTLVLPPIIMPKLAHRRYRKDPAMQGQFTVNITPASLSVQNTVRALTQFEWNRGVFWYEAKNVVVLIFRRPLARYLISLASLSESQRDELRGILTAALPKK